MAGIKMTHVPYRGSLPALNDVLAGHIQLMFVDLPPAVGMIESGKIRALGVTPAKRLAALPNVPTIAEAGVPEMPVDAWFGVFVPARTPPAIIDKIANEVRTVEHIPEVRKRIEGTYYRPVANTPAEFAALLRQEQVTWKRVVDALGLKPPQ
jgi:tripartite-type tricarboxylate transporter receptor subunit TctC